MAHQSVDEWRTLDELRALIEPLGDLEHTVITMRFGLDGEIHTPEEVERALGVTREQVQQIESKALKLTHRLGLSWLITPK